MAKHRTHSIEFKRQVVQEFLVGESPHALAKRHSIRGDFCFEDFAHSPSPKNLSKTGSAHKGG